MSGSVRMPAQAAATLMCLNTCVALNMDKTTPFMSKLHQRSEDALDVVLQVLEGSALEEVEQVPDVTLPGDLVEVALAFASIRTLEDCPTLGPIEEAGHMLHEVSGSSGKDASFDEVLEFARKVVEVANH